MSTFEYKGNTYRVIDFDNQYTAEQDDLFSRVITKVNKAFEFAITNAENLQDQKKVFSLIEEGFSDIKGRTVAELLAHTYLNDKEEVFNAETFEPRVEMFLKMPFNKRRELEKAIPKFLLDVMKSGAEGILNYLPIPQTQTQP